MGLKRVYSIYFKKKEDLAVACFLDGIERIDALMMEALKAPTPQRRVRRLIELWLELHGRIVAGETPAISMFNDIRALDKPLRVFVLTEYMKFAEGSVRPVDPFIAAQMLTATLNATAEIRWWIPDVSPGNAAALYAKPMLMGLLSR